MSTVGQALAPLVTATRGALEWLIESGDVDLEVPADFVLPPLGMIAPEKVVVAPEPVVETPFEPEFPPIERPTLLPGAPTPSLSDLTGLSGGDTTFIDDPSLLVGPAEAALVFGWPKVRVAFIAGPLSENADDAVVQASGEMVTNMAKAMGLHMGQAFFGYLAGAHSERPTASAARKAVRRQLAVAKPEVIVALGDFAVRALCGSKGSFALTRGKWHTFEGVDLMPTFHPEALQQSTSGNNKKLVWQDLQSVMRKLGIDRRRR